jgi:hypothetical protein
MTFTDYDSDFHVGELLSGYLDGELTQQTRQRVELHLDTCESCRGSLQDLEAVRARMGRARLAGYDSDRWRENMSDTTERMTRGIGWLLFLGALVLMGGVGVYEFLTDPKVEMFWKVLISAFYLGLGALFVSVLRQRLIERKTDRYKDVEI